MKVRSLLLFIYLFIQATASFAQISIIPLPRSIEYGKGSFPLKEHIHICPMDSSFMPEAELFREQAKQLAGIEAGICPGKPCKSNYIEILKNLEGIPESYSLLITKKKITLVAPDNAGVWYGLQSLLQAMSTAKDKKIPTALIQDDPGYAWRGMHLDVCRHFFSKEEVKKYIDYLSLYKMNVFHWHLTEDQGWRIEIKKYPKLTSTGAWRSGSMIGPYKDQKFDNIRYGGFYTQEDIREVVAYAAERHITVVPEIEMPGHALAALASYPEYSCTGGPFEVGKAWGVYDDVYCAGNDNTFIFLQNILDEVITLFPGEYLHIGGDECPKTRWKACERCQKRMQDNNLKDEHELQSYFIQRIEKYVNSKGKKIIGWDEILEGGLAPNAAVMSWRGTDGGMAAARAKHNAVMTPGKPCYFDHYQNADKKNEPLAIGGLNTLKDVYDYYPVPQALEDDEEKYILGAQGNVWTEYMTSFAQVEYMALPRMAALAEVLWSMPSSRNYNDFLSRLKAQSVQLDKKKANYCRHFLTDLNKVNK
jgi:hexosaminidase